jgi:hypothetical protein
MMNKGVLVAHSAADHEAGLAAPPGGNDARLRQWVASRMIDQEVVAVWRPSPEGVSKLSQAMNVGLCIVLCVFLPLCVFIATSIRDGNLPFLPTFPFSLMALLVITSIYCSSAYTVAAKKAEVYVVTRTGVAVLTEDYSPPCACSCTTGIDHVVVPWSQVLSISVDNAGRGCGCVKIPTVSIMLPGVHATGGGEHRHYAQNKTVWLVDEPAQVAAYLLRCKAQFEFQPMAAAMSNAVAPAIMLRTGGTPLMSAMPVAQVADMRVFCSLAGDPSRTGVIAVAPNMSPAQIAALAAEALGVRSNSATVLLSKNGKAFPITSAATLAPNDEIVLHAH